MSKIYVDEIAPKTVGNKVLMPQGGIIQMQYTQFTGTNSVALSAETDAVLTDLTVNITPTSASSVIHLQAHIFGEHSDDASGVPWNHALFFYRDSTKLAHATAGSRTVGISMTTRTYHGQDHSTTPEIARYDYFDTPATTSQITYKCGIVASTAETFYINRTVSDTDVKSRERGISFISATEIAG
jgi:hypothetical protein